MVGFEVVVTTTDDGKLAGDVDDGHFRNFAISFSLGDVSLESFHILESLGPVATRHSIEEVGSIMSKFLDVLFTCSG